MYVAPPEVIFLDVTAEPSPDSRRQQSSTWCSFVLTQRLRGFYIAIQSNSRQTKRAMVDGTLPTRVLRGVVVVRCNEMKWPSILPASAPLSSAATWRLQWPSDIHGAHFSSQQMETSATMSFHFPCLIWPTAMIYSRTLYSFPHDGWAFTLKTSR